MVTATADGCLDIQRGVLQFSPKGRVHGRLAMAASRALAADVALSWKVKRGGGRVRLNLCGAGERSLPARMGLPFLTTFKSLPLYGFQREGVARLLRSRRLLLADDMGLGKTIQVVGAMRNLIASGRIRHALVVAPATLLQNWIREMSGWTPELVVALGGPGRRMKIQGWRSLTDHCHVVVTNYESVRDGMDTNDPWNVDLLVVDEAHRLKNWDSKTTSVVRLVQAQRVWALTGTPLERDSEDLANLLAFLDQNSFTSDDKSLPTSVLRSRARRFVLRRDKADVLRELPAVVTKHELLPMGRAQKEAYRRESSSQSHDNPLVKFTRMRTICDYDPDTEESSKIDRIVAILRDVAGAGEKAVVFSYILDPLRLIESNLKKYGIRYERLIGAMDTTTRREAIDRFRHGVPMVLLASMRIGSEGLTLVEANHVLLVNRWWNPSLNQQAIDRVVRIGQHRTVFVYTFALADTIEEDLDRVLTQKNELFDELVKRLSVGDSSKSRRSTASGFIETCIGELDSVDRKDFSS